MHEGRQADGEGLLLGLEGAALPGEAQGLPLCFITAAYERDPNLTLLRNHGQEHSELRTMLH